MYYTAYASATAITIYCYYCYLINFITGMLNHSSHLLGRVMVVT